MSETELVERLERLEAATFRGQTVPQTITAHGFNVVDDSGRVRLRLGIIEGGPTIQFFDARDKPRMQITLTLEGAPSIWLCDAEIAPRVGISLDSSGEPGIGLCDAQGQVRALMGYNPEGGRGNGILDAQGKLQVGMDTDSSGKPKVRLCDSEGKKRLEMLLTSSGEPSIGLSDARGFEMHLGSVGTVKSDTGATEQTSAASIIMSDEEHHLIWQAP
jgi:hypothetical protein